MKEEIHDGERVRVLMAKQGCSKTDFATQMDMARTTLDRLLESPHWPTNHLVKASKILKSNLFRPYVESAGTNRGVVFLNGENGMEVYALERLEDFGLDDLKSVLNQEDENDTDK